MTHIAFMKTPVGFMPADPVTEEFAGKIKQGEIIHADFRRLRNAAFHRKLFALLNLAFEYFEVPDIDTKWGKPQKNFEAFRKNVTILAGYGHPVFYIDGSFHMVADSISFGSMGQDTFDKLYQSVLTVLMDRIPMFKGMAQDQINELVEKFLQFG